MVGGERERDKEKGGWRKVLCRLGLLYLVGSDRAQGEPIFQREFLLLSFSMYVD